MKKLRVTSYDCVEDDILEVSDIIEVDLPDDPEGANDAIMQNPNILAVMRKLLTGTPGEGVRVVLERFDDAR